MKEQYCIYLKWPRYLAQWYAHEMYRLSRWEDDVLPEYHYNCDVSDVRQLEPINTRRGSIERNVLEMCLTKQPVDYVERIDRESTICIVLPNFIQKPPCVYNHLKPASKSLLEQTVRNHFRMELYKYMMKLRDYSTPLDTLLVSFMENNGIENTETNLFAIKQIWNRLRIREK